MKLRSPKSRWAYFSHQHSVEAGCVIRIYRTPSGSNLYVTGFGFTQDPTESGYHYTQTITLGKMKGWTFIHSYTVEEDNPPQEYLEDPEEQAA